MTSVATRKGRPTADEARQKLARVLSVAREQFIQLGYRAVTMRGVAENAQVSTRTVYDRYSDKLSLFTACLDLGAEAGFPRLKPQPHADVSRVLEEHAGAIVRALSEDSSLRLGMLVYREGADFPELLRAAEVNEERYLVRPLATYLRQAGLEGRGRDERAKLFIAMSLSEWQRRVSHRRRLPNTEEVARHAELVVAVFLGGARAAVAVS